MIHADNYVKNGGTYIQNIDVTFGALPLANNPINIAASGMYHHRKPFISATTQNKYRLQAESVIHYYLKMNCPK
jgi:hypothetical protein